MADPARPEIIRPEFDSGDGMHLNDAGAVPADDLDPGMVFNQAARVSAVQSPSTSTGRRDSMSVRIVP